MADTDAPPIQVATVTMSVYDWHLLLRGMESLMSFRNGLQRFGGLGSEEVIHLYEQVSSQLCQLPVVVKGDAS